MPVAIGSGQVLPTERTGRDPGEVRKPAADGKGQSFEQVLDQTLKREHTARLKFSAHAVERMRAHGIRIDQAVKARLEQALEQARAKGIKDSLIVTQDASFIVNVPNSAVVTIVPRGAPQGDVFTQIDGAVIT